MVQTGMLGAAAPQGLDIAGTIVLRVAYDGRAYSGFAEQPSAPTVARELRRALETFLRREVDITCAGRTDAGGELSHAFLRARDRTRPLAQGHGRAAAR